MLNLRNGGFQKIMLMAFIIVICIFFLIRGKEVLPQTPQSKKKVSRELSFLRSLYVLRFNLSGNTVFTNKELAEVIASYEERDISPEELQAVRNELTLFYVHRGYITSGVIIPDQSVIDGRN